MAYILYIKYSVPSTNVNNMKLLLLARNPHYITTARTLQSFQRQQQQGLTYAIHHYNHTTQ